MWIMVANFLIDNFEWSKKGKAKKLEGVFSVGDSLILRVITQIGRDLQGQYFDFHQTLPAHWLLMVSYYHMASDALVWFQDTLGTSQFTSWEAFIRVLLMRFGPIAYDDPMEAFTCLKQTSIVLTYNSQFECLCNSLRGLSDHYKISCFLSGLKDKINLPIRMLNPINLGVAFGLAKIQEEHLLSAKNSETSFK